MGSRPWKQDFATWMEKKWDHRTLLKFERGWTMIDGFFDGCDEVSFSKWHVRIEDREGKTHHLLLDRKLHINGEPVVLWWDKLAHPWMVRPGSMH